MYHLRLIMGLSYDGAVHATRKDPDVYTEDRAAVEEAVASGYFALIGETAIQEGENVDEEEAAPSEERPDLEALAAKTKAELIAFAEEHEIDLAGCRTKADILGAISVAYGGSYTMIDLQTQK